MIQDRSNGMIMNLSDDTFFDWLIVWDNMSIFISVMSISISVDQRVCGTIVVENGW